MAQTYCNMRSFMYFFKGVPRARRRQDVPLNGAVPRDVVDAEVHRAGGPPSEAGSEPGVALLTASTRGSRTSTAGAAGRRPGELAQTSAHVRLMTLSDRLARAYGRFV